jgi:hypothetical protein
MRRRSRALLPPPSQPEANLPDSFFLNVACTSCCTPPAQESTAAWVLLRVLPPLLDEVQAVQGSPALAAVLLVVLGTCGTCSDRQAAGSNEVE